MLSRRECLIMKEFKLLKRKLISGIIFLTMFASLFLPYFSLNTQAGIDKAITLIACSDFQNPYGNEAGKQNVKQILDNMKDKGISHADGLFACGDYDYEYTETAQGIEALKEVAGEVVTGDMIFVQGNHDSADKSTGIASSGNNDPASNEYGVFVINEDDYMWNNSSEATIKDTTERLMEYVNEKLSQNYDKPIFVLSHLPLHYSMRTKYQGDGMYANYIFNVLNQAGERGLNIIFLYGHDHSYGWDDYLGGAAVYLPKGDEILIAQKSQTNFKKEQLNFTYMNAGYIGYYAEENAGTDATLTMTAFTISDNSVTIARYNKNSVHTLKSSGVQNSYVGEVEYLPNTKVYHSSQTVELTSVTDSTPITTYTDTKYNVSLYKGDKDSEDWTYPTVYGKVFAGWYEDIDCETPYMATTGKAYAKFVNRDILTVRKQLQSETTVESETTSIRFITSIDLLKYALVGFDVLVGGDSNRTFDLQEKQVYTSMLIDGVVQPQTPMGVFGTNDAQYFALHSINEIPNAAFDDTFTVTPYWYTLDGTKVGGESNKFTINSLLGKDPSAYIDFGDDINWESYFATAQGQESCAYVMSATISGSAVHNAVRYHANGTWPTFGGFKPVKKATDYEQYINGKFVIEMSVASYSSQWNNLGFYVRPVWGADTRIQSINHTGTYSIEIPATTILDYWDSFVNGAAVFYFDDGGESISIDCYFTGMYFKEEEIKEPVAEHIFLDFTDKSNWIGNFATVSGQSSCSYVDAATVNGTNIENAIHFSQNGEWPGVKGFVPVYDKNHYEQYRGGYFVVEFYLNSFTQPWDGALPEFAIKVNGVQNNVLTDINVGAHVAKISADTILDNWDSFLTSATSKLLFEQGGNNFTVDCYFTGMYFEGVEKPVVPEEIDPVLSTYIDFTDEANWTSYFAPEVGQDKCSYDSENQAVKVVAEGWDPLAIGCFKALREKSDYAQYQGGKFVIELDIIKTVVGFTDGRDANTPDLYIATPAGAYYKIADLQSSGKQVIEIVADEILNDKNWEGFVLQFKQDDGGWIDINVNFTAMYLKK